MGIKSNIWLLNFLSSHHFFIVTSARGTPKITRTRAPGTIQPDLCKNLPIWQKDFGYFEGLYLELGIIWYQQRQYFLFRANSNCCEWPKYLAIWSLCPWKPLDGRLSKMYHSIWSQYLANCDQESMLSWNSKNSPF